MIKVYYQILHLPLTESGYYPDESEEEYFRPWVDLAVEDGGKLSIIQMPCFLLDAEEEDEMFGFYC